MQYKVLIFCLFSSQGSLVLTVRTLKCSILCKQASHRIVVFYKIQKTKASVYSLYALNNETNICLISLNISSCHFLCSRTQFSLTPDLLSVNSLESKRPSDHGRLLEDACCLLDWLDDFCRPLPAPCLKTAYSASVR